MQRVITLAREHGIVAATTQYPLEDVNQALRDLADHKIAERALLLF
jgi:propanol-preferring alcohol dehydrogenase